MALVQSSFGAARGQGCPEETGEGSKDGGILSRSFWGGRGFVCNTIKRRRCLCCHMYPDLGACVQN